MMKRKLFALMLTLTLVLSYMPWAFAETGEGEQADTESVESVESAENNSTESVGEPATVEQEEIEDKQDDQQEAEKEQAPADPEEPINEAEVVTNNSGEKSEDADGAEVLEVKNNSEDVPKRGSESATIVSISYQRPSGNITYYEGINGEDTEEWSEEGTLVGTYYRFYDPFPEYDDILTVTYDDGGTATYIYESEKGCFVNRSDSTDYFDHYDNSVFSISTDQSFDHPWEAPGEYTFTVKYRGVTCVSDSKIIIKPFPIVSIAFERVDGDEDYICYENIDGNETTDWIEGQQVSYFRYNDIHFTDGDILTVTYNDGRGVVTYIHDSTRMGFVNQADSNDRISTEEDRFISIRPVVAQSYTNQWQVGHEYTYTVQYRGVSCTPNSRIRILSNPVESISYVHVGGRIKLYKGINDSPTFRYIDGQFVSYSVYIVPGFGTDDILTVTYNDGRGTRSYIYEQGVFVNPDIPNDRIKDHFSISTDQSYNNQWEVGGEYTYTVNYLNKTCVPDCIVEIHPFPIDSISFERASGDIVVYEETNGRWDPYWVDPEDEFYCYDFPGFEEGDTLTVTYNDGRGTVRYIFQVVPPAPSGSILDAFVNEHDDTDRIHCSDVSASSNQSSQNRWIAGGEYPYTISYKGVKCTPESHYIIKAQGEITNANLVLQNEITSNLYATVTENVSDVSMTVTMNGKESEIEGTLKNDKYVFEYKDISPENIGDEYTAVLNYTLDGQQHTNELNYSVKEYCMDVLNMKDSELAAVGLPATATVDETRTLMVDTLNYGAAAQLLTGHNTGDLATSELRADQKALATEYVPPTAEEGLVTDMLEGTKDENYDWYSAKVILDNAAKLRFYFMAPNGTDGLTVKLNGNPATIQSTSTAGKYYVELTDIAADTFRDEIVGTFEVNGEQTGRTLRYSLNTYIGHTDDHETFGTMAQMLYNYGQSSYAYTH